MSLLLLSKIFPKIYHRPSEAGALHRATRRFGQCAKSLAHKLRHPFAAPERNPDTKSFWALKDVSFDISRVTGLGSSVVTVQENPRC